MPASGFKLHYFEGRGRAELARLCFAVTKTPFEDCRYKMKEDWPAIKPTMPLQQLPVLEFSCNGESKKMPQSRAIARMIAAEGNISGKCNGEKAKCDAVVDTLGEIMDHGFMFLFAPDPVKEKAKEKFMERVTTISGMLSKCLADRDWIVGDTMTWADLALMDVCYMLMHTRPDPTKPEPFKEACEVMKSHANLVKHFERVCAVPEVKTWMDKRPKTDF